VADTRIVAPTRRSRMYDYRVVEWTNERCTIDIHGDGKEGEPKVTFTDADARRAGLDRSHPTTRAFRAIRSSPAR
jgi:hypothetical protein